MKVGKPILLFVGALALTMTTFQPGYAAAQEEEGRQVQATPKGTIGMGLLGAELGLFVPAVCGLDETWSLIVFPIVGAAGGAIGGYFLFDKKDNETAAVAMMATGMALLVPAIVGTLASTAYDPHDEPDDEDFESDDEEEEDFGDDADELGDDPIDEPLDDGEETQDAEPSEDDEGWDDTRRIDMTQLQAGLLQLRPTGLRLGIPGIAVLASATPTEVQRYGATPRPEFHVSLMSGAF